MLCVVCVIDSRDAVSLYNIALLVSNPDSFIFFFFEDDNEIEEREEREKLEETVKREEKEKREVTNEMIMKTAKESKVETLSGSMQLLHDRGEKERRINRRRRR